MVKNANVVEQQTQHAQAVPPIKRGGATPPVGTKKYVVHCKKEPFDVYIGRPSPWGNPFSDRPKTLAEVRVDTREDAIACFREWVMQQPEFVTKIRQELKGKVLGCWCSPLACHGDVLAEIANE